MVNVIFSKMRNQRNVNWQSEENKLSLKGKNDGEGGSFITLAQYFGCAVCCYNEFLAQTFKDI